MRTNEHQETLESLAGIRLGPESLAWLCRESQRAADEDTTDSERWRGSGPQIRIQHIDIHPLHRYHGHSAWFVAVVCSAI